MQSHMETGRDPTWAKINTLCFSALIDVGYGAFNLKLMLSNDNLKLISTSPALHSRFVSY